MACAVSCAGPIREGRHRLIGKGKEPKRKRRRTSSGLSSNSLARPGCHLSPCGCAKGRSTICTTTARVTNTHTHTHTKGDPVMRRTTENGARAFSNHLGGLFVAPSLAPLRIEPTKKLLRREGSGPLSLPPPPPSSCFFSHCAREHACFMP